MRTSREAEPRSVDSDDFEVLLIPHPLEVTTWGERVTIEVDQMVR
jgi:riboflavin synthase alpha subunit